MNVLDRTSELYMTYVARLQEQESRIQSFREQVIRHKESLVELDKSLRALVDGLTIEG